MAGSLRIFSKKKIEQKSKIYLTKKFTIKDINNFKKNIKIVVKKIVQFVNKKKIEKKLILGVGAATKGNTLLNMCKFTFKDIPYILEKSPHKIGKFTPGSGISIINENSSPKFDSIIVLPWNISSYLLKKFKIKNKQSFVSIQKLANNLKHD